MQLCTKRSTYNLPFSVLFVLFSVVVIECTMLKLLLWK